MVLSSKKKLSIGVGGAVLSLVVLMSINGFVYPFVSAKPNYTDVEAVFNKLQVPSDWVEIEKSENKGIAGRRCPIESDGCFSKERSFKVPENVSDNSLIVVLKNSGCVSPSLSRTKVLNRKDRVTSECSSGGVRVLGSLTDRGGGYESSIIATTN